MNEKDFLEFAKIIGKLKKTLRTGWKIRGIRNPESVADHIFRTIVLGMIIADIRKLKKEKILKMLILHDLEESITGDIPTLEKEKMSKKNKEIGERAMKSVLSKLPLGLRKEYFNLWKEFEEGKTKEAKFCRDIDILEMIIQIFEYKKEQASRKKVLEIFWKNAQKRLKDPSLRKILKELKKSDIK